MNIFLRYKDFPFLPKSQFVGDTLTLASGTAVAHVISFAAAPVLTRLYTPEQFGIFSLYSVVVSIASILTCLSYETAIVLPEDDREAAELLVASIMITLLMTSFSLAIIFLFGQELATFLKAPELLSILWWVPLNLLAVGTWQTLRYWNTRRRQFGRLSISRVWQSGVTAATQIGGGMAGSGATSLVYGQIVGQVVASSVLMIDAAKSRVLSLRKGLSNLSEYTALLYRYRNFPLYSTGGTLLNTAAFQCAPIFLVMLFDPAVAGFYFLAVRIMSVPMAFMGVALGQVLLQRAAAELLQERSVSRLVASVVGRSILLWAPAFIVITLVAPSAFSIFFGPEWVTAGSYLQVLTPLFFSQLIVSPASVVLIALEKQHVLAALQALLLLGAIGSLGVAGYASSSPRVVLTVYAVCQSVVYMLYLVAIIRYSSTSAREIVREATSFKNRIWGA